MLSTVSMSERLCIGGFISCLLAIDKLYLSNGDRKTQSVTVTFPRGLVMLKGHSKCCQIINDTGKLPLGFPASRKLTPRCTQKEQHGAGLGT